MLPYQYRRSRPSGGWDQNYLTQKVTKENQKISPISLQDKGRTKEGQKKDKRRTKERQRKDKVKRKDG